MGQTTKSVAIRISTDGKAQVEADYKDIGAAAQQAGKAAADGADQAAAASDRQIASLQRQANAAKAQAAASQSQGAFNAVLGVGAAPSKSAASSAEVFAEAAAAMEKQEAQAIALRSAIDPLWAAQQKLGTATAEVNGLLEAGLITTTEHAAGLKLAQTAYTDAEKAAEAMGGGVGFSTMQMQEFGAVAHRSFDAIAAGMPISRVATMEGARLGAALGSGEGGVAGALGAVAAVATSTWGLIVEGVIVLGALAAAGILYADSEKKIAQALQGSGAASQVTLAQLEALADAQAKASGVSVSAARDIDTAMAGTGRGTVASLAPAVDAVKAYQALTGASLKDATAAVQKAYTDPASAASDWASKLNILSAAEVDHIKQLELQGDRGAALKQVMADLTGSAAGLTPQLGFLATVGHLVGDAWSDAATAIGKYVSKLPGAQGPDPAAQLAKYQKQLADTLKSSPDDVGEIDQLRANISYYQGKVADAAGQAAKDASAKARDAANQASNDVAALIQKVDPAIGRIRDLNSEIKRLQDLQANPSKLAGTQYNAGDVSNALAASQKELADLKKKADGEDAHAQSLARELAAMRANADGSLAMAAAYAVSEAAGMKAEAARKAQTDATKKGGDVAAFVSAQLQEDAAGAAATGEKNAAQIKSEAAARTALNEQVAAGTITSDQAVRQLQLEMQLRPLAIAAENGNADAKKALAKTSAELTDATKANNASLATAAVLAANANDADTLAQLKLQIAMVGDLTGARERDLAMLQAQQRAAHDGATPQEQASRGQSAADVVAAQTALKRSQYYDQTIRSQGDSLALTQAELGLIGQTQTAHDAVIDRLKAEQALQAQGISLTSDYAKGVLAGVAANDQLQAKLRDVQTNWNELKSAGDGFVDDVLNPSNWSSWQNVGQLAIKDIGLELEKLALINPLKNALFGESNATLSGVGGLLGSLFGGGASGVVPTSSVVSSFASFNPFGLAGFASGTNFAPGGLVQVDEKGAEIMNLPRGSNVVSAGKSVDLVSSAAAETLANMQKVAANQNGAGVNVRMGDIYIDAKGAGADALAKLQATVDDLNRTLPTRAVAAVQDAQKRRII